MVVMDVVSAISALISSNPKFENRGVSRDDYNSGTLPTDSILIGDICYS